MPAARRVPNPCSRPEQADQILVRLRNNTTSSFRVGLIGAALALVWIGVQLYINRDVVVPSSTFVTTFANSDRAIDVLLARGDGQAFAQLARDPFLNDPEPWRNVGIEEMAYRAQRPVGFYVMWLLSFGNPDWVETAAIATTVLGCGVLTTGTAMVLRQRGLSPLLALTSLLVPGVLAAFPVLMPDPLALGLAVVGFALWQHEAAHQRAAVGLFCLAVLTRETMILFPFALGLIELVTNRRIRWGLALPALSYLAWWMAVRLTLGLDLSGSGATSQRVAWPGQAVFHSTESWAVTTDWLILTATVALVLYAVIWHHQDPLTWVVVCGFVLGTVMGTDVWTGWANWTRALSPLHFGALIVLLTAIRSDAGPRSSVDRASVS